MPVLTPGAGIAGGGPRRGGRGHPTSLGRPSPNSCVIGHVKMVSRDVHQFGIGLQVRARLGPVQANPFHPLPPAVRRSMQDGPRGLSALFDTRCTPCADRRRNGSQAAWDRAKPWRRFAPDCRQRDDDAEADSDSETDSEVEAGSDDAAEADSEGEPDDDETGAGPATSAGAGDDDGAPYT